MKTDFEIQLEQEEMYDNFLNEFCPLVVIGSLEYEPAYVLKNVDPIAYHVGMQDYLDSIEEG
jgi:hypothetical protein